MIDFVAVGLVCRDLVVRVEQLPPAGSAAVQERVETLGGVANQSVGVCQLGGTAGVIGAVGDDAAGAMVLQQARDDGLDITGVARRPQARTSLVVDVVAAGGTSRLLEHVTPKTQLTVADVHRAGSVIRGASAVAVGLRGPTGPVVEAVRLADAAGALVVVDGALDEPEANAEVIARAGVVRADLAEAGALVGRELQDGDDVVDAARELLAAGARCVALGAGSEGNVLAWPGGQQLYPLLGGEPVDPTGGGDAFVAGLVTALLSGKDPLTAGWWASAAAALTVVRPGGRPALNSRQVEAMAGRAAAR